MVTLSPPVSELRLQHLLPHRGTWQQWMSVFSMLGDEVAPHLPGVGVPVASHTSPAFPVSHQTIVVMTLKRKKRASCFGAGCKHHVQNKTFSHKWSAVTQAGRPLSLLLLLTQSLRTFPGKLKGCCLYGSRETPLETPFSEALLLLKEKKSGTRKEHCVLCNRILKICSRLIWI